MRPLLLTLSGAPDLTERLVADYDLERGTFETRKFPDGETYLRLVTPVDNRDVVLLCGLDRPDEKVLALLFAADTARVEGARSVGLVAPYLGYMRQDKAFQPGEAITSLTFARLLSDALDWLITVDPHLHRHPSLDAIYSIPGFAASAAAPVADWVRVQVENPVLIGPDEESEQWVSHIAGLAGARATVLRKTRRGDFDVSIAGEALNLPPDSTPVIIDDIASSARTMIETVRLVQTLGHRAPVCIAVHPIFAGDAFDRLRARGPAAIVSSNTIAHPSNAIDVSGQIGAVLEQAIAAGATHRRRRS